MQYVHTVYINIVVYITLAYIHIYTQAYRTAATICINSVR